MLSLKEIQIILKTAKSKGTICKYKINDGDVYIMKKEDCFFYCIGYLAEDPHLYMNMLSLKMIDNV
jgi:hypothetical protein